MPGAGLRVRALALATSLISLAASVLFSVAVTRKLPLLDVGVLNVFTAAVSLGTIPASIVSFASPRLAAKYRAAEAGVLAASATVSLAGAAVSAAYLLGLSQRLAGRYFDLILVLATLSSLTSSLSAASTGFLTALDRPRMLYTTLVTSVVKLASIYYILRSGWSLQSVLVSSFAIYLAGLAYSMAAAAPYASRSRGFRAPLREFLSGAWVPLLGYASNNLRSLDTMFIAALGGLVDNALWQVIYMVGKLYGFVGNLINVSYGELLSSGGTSRVYYDLLMVLSTTTAISLAVVAFEPYVVEFLRPRDPYLVPELALPVLLWAAGNVLGSFSQYVSAVMQGMDRVDMTGEIRARTYLGSMVLRAHNAELVMTVAYLALIYPMVVVARMASLKLYVIYGVIMAGILASTAATAYRLAGLRGAGRILGVRFLPRDYALPTAAAAVALLALRGPLMAVMRPTTSAAWGVLELAIAFSVTGAIYAAAEATSPRMRRIMAAVARRILSALARGTRAPAPRTARRRWRAPPCNPPKRRPRTPGSPPRR
ncbi:MAG: hypothetical protein ACP5ID_02000 [Conexivisphaera sp.]